MEYFGLKMGQDLGTGRHTPTKNSEEYHPPPPTHRAIELLKTSSDPQITNGVEGSEVKQDTVPMKGQSTLTNINLLLFVKINCMELSTMKVIFPME